MSALPPEQRPFVDEAVTTEGLPATPVRDRRIPATAWADAPDALLHLGDDIDASAEYKRRIGRYLLWRAGPPVGEARYMAVSDDLTRILTFDLHGRSGRGVGADGRVHARLRTWKESLRDDGAIR